MRNKKLDPVTTRIAQQILAKVRVIKDGLKSISKKTSKKVKGSSVGKKTQKKKAVGKKRVSKKRN